MIAETYQCRVCGEPRPHHHTFYGVVFANDARPAPPDATLDGLLAKRDEACYRHEVAETNAAIRAHVAQREAALREERDRHRTNAEMADGCLDMVREVLEVVLGKEAMEGTPPMMYPEAIRQALYLAHRGKWGSCQDADCDRCPYPVPPEVDIDAALASPPPATAEGRTITANPIFVSPGYAAEVHARKNMEGSDHGAEGGEVIRRPRDR